VGCGTLPACSTGFPAGNTPLWLVGECDRHTISLSHTQCAIQDEATRLTKSLCGACGGGTVTVCLAGIACDGSSGPLGLAHFHRAGTCEVSWGGPRTPPVWTPPLPSTAVSPRVRGGGALARLARLVCICIAHSLQRDRQDSFCDLTNNSSQPSGARHLHVLLSRGCWRGPRGF